MTLQELQQQALQLPVDERSRLAEFIIASIQKEALKDLDPWTQSLIGVISLESDDPTDAYVDYLEEKYR